MDWTNKNVNPSKVVQLGDETQVMILDVDAERRRISLGMKQCTPNPWEAFAAMNKKNDKVSGQVKSITDFGIFIGLEGGIDGLVHLSDISWNTTGEDIVRNFKKGDTVEAVVLAVDPERERISLGIKQMEQDPFGSFVAQRQKGAIVNGTVKEVDARGATVDLGDGVEGYIRASDIAKERVEDASQHLKVGDTIEAKIVGTDRKSRVLQLSIRAKDEAEVQETLAEYNKSAAEASSGTTKLGALLREQLGNRE
jgi:small subunit ribosomal protein S1